MKQKRKKESITHLHISPTETLWDGAEIANYCVSHFSHILSKAPSVDLPTTQSQGTILSGLTQVISSTDAHRLEQVFDDKELYIALQKLGNEKPPGWDGITKEFLLCFWDNLKFIIVDIINTSWLTQSLDSFFLKGIIKLIPKQIFCSSIHQWRPITMLNAIYKIFAKAIALRLDPFLRAHVHINQHGLIGGRSILDNILTVQLGIEYAQSTNQDMVLLQLDFAKAFDTVRWEFIALVLSTMGFG